MAGMHADPARPVSSRDNAAQAAAGRRPLRATAPEWAPQQRPGARQQPVPPQGHPQVPLQERVFVIVDLHPEMNGTEFSGKRKGEQQGTRWEVLQNMLMVFEANRKRISEHCQFGTAGLMDGLIDLSPLGEEDIRQGLHIADQLRAVQDCQKNPVDLTCIYTFMAEQIAHFSPHPGLHHWHCLLIYGRSNQVPTFNPRDPAVVRLRQNPCFNLDILYLHNQNRDASPSQQALAVLKEVATPPLGSPPLKGGPKSAYIFEACQNQARLAHYFALLLAHPAQRPAEWSDLTRTPPAHRAAADRSATPPRHGSPEMPPQQQAERGSRRNSGPI
eukprot:TRINITY_DN12479_c0_g1_i1.p2 TRINITY_DN12479_c0_g1~~TRINITY_DN12479_c0_g1_i1.p2  ORF type:complete len:330 (+),score=107.24 TRINITY_DN12479_c0_g1_i1:120-1109(+)